MNLGGSPFGVGGAGWGAGVRAATGDAVGRARDVNHAAPCQAATPATSAAVAMMAIA